MFEIASALILYVLGFPCLYGIIRIAVRHGLEDAARIAREEQAGMPAHPNPVEGVLSAGA
jgi:hypothetical protein